LPSANGSSRVCFADGTEAIIGVKAEVEKSQIRVGYGEHGAHLGTSGGGDAEDDDEGEGGGGSAGKGAGESSWVEVSIEVPGVRDDDALPIFLSAMLTEAFVADGRLKDRLWINRRFHWKLYIDVGWLCATSFNLNLLTILDPTLVGATKLSITPPLHYHTSSVAFRPIT
jgi:exosome complex component RRP42